MSGGLPDGIRHGDGLDDRQLMGLPTTVVQRLPDDFLVVVGRLRSTDTQTLAAMIEDASRPFAHRYAAGRLLGLVGDPRVDTFNPATVHVPGGAVILGLSLKEVDGVVNEWSSVGVIRDWILKEVPTYAARVPSLNFMRYLVTNHDYREFLRATDWPELPTSWAFGTYPDGRGNEPVWTVTPRAADEYAAWLSAATGRHFRLPTEAEWENAAAGGEGREYPWGDSFDPGRLNTVEQGPLSASPVGCYPSGRSLHGIDDMGGNVEEWVADEYTPYPGGDVVNDDLRSIQGRYRVCRGGSFTRFGDLARTRRRHGRYERPIYVVGFRIVEVADAPGTEATTQQ